MNAEEIIMLLEKSLKYTPIVYKQSLFDINQNNFDNIYTLEYKYTELPDDSLLFFVPSVSSNDKENKKCKLRIRVPNDTYKRYTEIVYPIIVEQNTDLPRAAGINDIIANRLCIFRFRKSSKQAILINSPLYNDAMFSSIKATNAEFTNKPFVRDNENPNITYELITTKEYNDLLNRVKSLESKIRFGTEEPEDALKDAPTGTVYIQYEAD